MILTDDATRYRTGTVPRAFFTTKSEGTLPEFRNTLIAYRQNLSTDVFPDDEIDIFCIVLINAR